MRFSAAPLTTSTAARLPTAHRPAVLVSPLHRWRAPGARLEPKKKGVHRFAPPEPVGRPAYRFLPPFF
ncbi:MAG: hypothetical protein ACRD1Q_12295, partial [Vicinamibacterales bacterium]